MYQFFLIILSTLPPLGQKVDTNGIHFKPSFFCDFLRSVLCPMSHAFLRRSNTTFGGYPLWMNFSHISSNLTSTAVCWLTTHLIFNSWPQGRESIIFLGWLLSYCNGLFPSVGFTYKSVTNASCDLSTLVSRNYTSSFEWVKVNWTSL